MDSPGRRRLREPSFLDIGFLIDFATLAADHPADTTFTKRFGPTPTRCYGCSGAFTQSAYFTNSGGEIVVLLEIGSAENHTMLCGADLGSGGANPLNVSIPLLPNSPAASTSPFAMCGESEIQITVTIASEGVTFGDLTAGHVEGRVLLAVPASSLPEIP